MTPQPTVVAIQPTQVTLRKSPVLVMMIPDMTETGATVNVAGKSATPAMMGL